MVATIEAIWVRVKSYEGAEFNTKTGKPFKYDVVGNSIRPQHTERIISKVNFEKVLDQQRIRFCQRFPSPPFFR